MNNLMQSACMYYWNFKFVQANAQENVIWFILFKLDVRARTMPDNSLHDIQVKNHPSAASQKIESCKNAI